MILANGMTQNGRLGYVDALRGFTMFLVVFNHVLYLSFDTQAQTFTSSFFSLFRMPMFFFISGFVGYKSIERWTLGFTLERTRQKLLVQTIPALFFFSLYTLCQGGNPLDCLHDGFGGYWFTFVLLEMLITYFALSLLAHYTHRRVLDIGLVAIALVLCYLSIGNRNDTALEKILSLESYLFFFQFFTMGILFRRYYAHVSKWLRTPWVSAALILCMILLCFVQFHAACHISGRLGMLLHFLCRISGVITLFMVFSHYESYFATDGRISSSIKFIGRRTLDIYLIHFFFLPDLSSHASWILPENQVLAQLCIGGGIAVVIIGLCLLCSQLLRTSDLLAHYLLGKKRQDIQ